MGMKPLIRRNGAITLACSDIPLEVMPIPVTSKVAVIHHDWTLRVDHMLDLANGMDRAELMRWNSYYATCGAVLPKYLLHPVFRILQMISVADEQKIRFSWKHVDDMGDDRLAVDLDQWFGNGISGTAEPLSETRHWNDDLHLFIRLICV
jgi:hypothetical protein